MDPETLKWFASLGVGGILGAGMFLYHRKDAREWLAVVAEQRDAYQKCADTLLQVVIGNSATIALNTAATKQNTEMLVTMKTEILDAFARSGQIDRRSQEHHHQPPHQQERRHRQ